MVEQSLVAQIKRLLRCSVQGQQFYLAPLISQAMSNKTKYYIRIDSDLGNFSFYTILNAPNQGGAERNVRMRFCVDFGGKMETCRVRYTLDLSKSKIDTGHTNEIDFYSPIK